MRVAGGAVGEAWHTEVIIVAGAVGASNSDLSEAVSVWAREIGDQAAPQLRQTSVMRLLELPAAGVDLPETTGRRKLTARRTHR